VAAPAAGKAAATWLLVIGALHLRSSSVSYGFSLQRMDRFFGFSYYCIVLRICISLFSPLSPLADLGLVCFSFSSLFGGWFGGLMAG